MTRTLLSGVAAIAFAFVAPSAFAQNSNVDPDIDAKVKTEQMIDEAEEAEDDVEETTDERADTRDDMWDTEDSEIDDPEDAIDDDVDKDVDTKGYVSPSVECPTGTTIQADGTCMTVSEWTPEN